MTAGKTILVLDRGIGGTVAATRLGKQLPLEHCIIINRTLIPVRLTHTVTITRGCRAHQVFQEMEWE